MSLAESIRELSKKNAMLSSLREEKDALEQKEAILCSTQAQSLDK